MKFVAMIDRGIQYLRKNEITALLNIVIFGIVFYLIDVYTYEFFDSNDKIAKMESYYKGDTKDIYCVQCGGYLDEKNSGFFKRLYELEGFSACCSFENSQIEFWYEKDDYTKYFYSDEMIRNGQCEEISPYDNVIDVYGNIDGIFNLLSEQNVDAIKKALGGKIPLIVGYDYKNTMPLGTVLKYPFNVIWNEGEDAPEKIEYMDCIVAGYFEKDQKFFESNDPEIQANGCINLNRMIFAFRTDFDEMNENMFYFKTDNPDRMIQKIKSLARRRKIEETVNVFSVKYAEKSRRKIITEEYSYVWKLMAVLVLALFLSVSSSSIVLFMKNRREIGIFYSFGVSRKSIFGTIFTTNILLVIFAIMGSYLYRSYEIINNSEINYDKKMLKNIMYIRNTYTVPSTAILGVVLILFASLVTYKMVNRYSIKQLIASS